MSRLELKLYNVDADRTRAMFDEALEAALREHGKTFEIQVYENAGHAFFSVHSQKYRTAAALAGWQRILAWFTRYLGPGQAAPGSP